MLNMRAHLSNCTKSLFVTALLLFLTATSSAIAEDWPQWMGRHRDNVWRENNIIESFPEDGATILWRCPVGGGYSGPAVANDPAEDP